MGSSPPFLLLLLSLLARDSPCTLAAVRAANIEDMFHSHLSWMQSGIDEAGLGSLQPPVAQSLALRPGRFGNSLFAKRRFSTAEIITYIPVSRLLMAGDQHSLAMMVAEQAALGTDSSFAPYLKTLPALHRERPVRSFNSELRSALNGSGSIHFIDSQADEVRRRFAEHVKDSPLGWDQYVWARDVVRTRCMRTSEWGVILFPLADFGNHDDDSFNMVLEPKEFKTADGKLVSAMVVTATRNVEPGEELLNQYYSAGKMSSWETAEIWGFLTEKTREMRKAARVRTLGIGGTDQFYLSESLSLEHGPEFLEFLQNTSETKLKDPTSPGVLEGLVLGRRLVQRELDQLSHLEKLNTAKIRALLRVRGHIIGHARNNM